MCIDVGAMQGELIRGEGRGNHARNRQHLDAGKCLLQIHTAPLVWVTRCSAPVTPPA